VSDGGLITARLPGDAVITCTTAEGVSRSCLVHVRLPVSSLSVSPEEARIKTHDLLPLTLSVSPALSDPTELLFTFSSSNPAVAAVDENGGVRGVSAGKAAITVTAYSGASAVCAISVRQRTQRRPWVIG